MTVKDIYDGVIIEMNQLNAQAFQLEEFNYYLYKIILAHVNDRAQAYNTTRLVADELRALRKTARFFTLSQTPEVLNKLSGNIVSFDSYSDHAFTMSVSSIGDLEEYSECLAYNTNNELVSFRVEEIETTKYPYVIEAEELGEEPPIHPLKPGSPIFSVAATNLTPEESMDVGDIIYNIVLPASDYMQLLSCRTFYTGRTNRVMVFPAKKMTEDMYDAIANNVYLKPKYSRPYYTAEDSLFNSGVVSSDLLDGKAYQNSLTLSLNTGSEFTKDANADLIEVEVKYLKLPEPTRLNEEDVWSVGIDTSQVLEFPDTLKNKFILDTVTLLLESHSQRNFQTHAQANDLVGGAPKTAELSGSDTAQNAQNAQKASQQ